MKNLSKILALVLCLAMTASVFACAAPAAPATEEPATAPATEPAAEAVEEPTTEAAEEPATETAETAEAPALEPCTLVWIGAGWQANGKAETIIQKWNEIHPDIKIEYTELGSLVDTDYLKNLDIMIAGGETVDVTYLGTQDMYNRVMNGGALPITQYITESGDDYEAEFTSLAATMCKYKDDLYGIPYSNNTFKVFYNKTMVEEAGVTIPETWSYQEFTEIAKQLNKDGVYGCIYPSTWEDLCYAPAEVSGWQSIKVADDGTVSPNFDDEVFKTCLQWIYDLAEVEKVSPSRATIMAESLNRRLALATGQTAMIVDGPYTLVWMQNYMFNDPGAGPLPFELGVAELPYITEEGKNVSFDTLVGAFYVPKTAAHPREAYAFEHFICTECSGIANYMPTYTGADMDQATETFTTYIDSKNETHENVYPKDVAVAAVSVPNESHIAYWHRDPAYAQYFSLMATLFNEQYSLFLGGEQTIDEFVANMQELGAAEIANVG